LVALIAALCFVGPAAQGATIIFDLRDHFDGTFDLYASASLGDNAGIAFFNVDLVNILTATQQSPKGLDDSLFITRGFDLGGGDLTGDGALWAGQNTASGDAPDNLVYGIGQTAGSFGTLGTPRGVPWDAPVLIGSGTYSMDTNPEFGAEVVGNVFTAEGGVDAEAADVVLIPEPVTLSILALGGLVMLRRKR
jgi:hypothetical protein